MAHIADPRNCEDVSLANGFAVQTSKQHCHVIGKIDFLLAMSMHARRRGSGAASPTAASPKPAGEGAVAVTDAAC